MRSAGLIVCVLSLLVAGDAFGASKDKNAKKKKTDTGVQETGIEAFDAVFARVGEIDAQLTSTESELRTGKRNLNTALDLQRGTPLTDGIAELQKRAEGKLQVTMAKGNVPKLSATDAIPSNVQSAVDAVNALSLNMTTSLTDMESLVPEIQGLIDEAGQMPDRLKDEFSGGTANIVDQLFKLPKTTKALKADIDLTLGLDDRAMSLTNRMTDLLDLVTTEFAPGGSGPSNGRGNQGTTGNKPAGGPGNKPAGGPGKKK
ncbi:MAG: hypothetical protein H6735_12025 [Alphaproteobacteria bacterium]|nr:hypothetical protein [Alphaproteobacteria bacterium]